MREEKSIHEDLPTKKHPNSNKLSHLFDFNGKKRIFVRLLWRAKLAALPNNHL